jgi:hypothetical protein
MRATNATRMITPRAGCMVRMPRVYSRMQNPASTSR